MLRLVGERFCAGERVGDDVFVFGRGKGFYDKILSQTKACKIGICFDFQLLDRIPTEVHDVRMTQVISSR